MNRCFMLRPTSPPNLIRVRRWAALGDTLSATVVADKLAGLGYGVEFQSHSSTHCLLRRVPSIAQVADGGNAEINLDGVYEKNAARARLHFSSMWMDASNSQLARLGIKLGPALNCKPVLRVDQNERRAAQAKFKEYPRPWVFVCPRSDAYACRQVPDGIWNEAARTMQGTKFWMGRHPAPPHFVDLKLQHVDNLIIWLSAADLLVTVDTGPMHIGAALGIPILALGQSSSPELHLSDQVDFLTINCQGLDCLNCQKNICPVPGRSTNPPCQSFDPAFIAQWANAKLRQKFDDRVSAVVAIYRPEAAIVNKCLEHLLPQVDEIVIAADAASQKPPGLMTHPKIRVVTKGLKDIGYGRKINFGLRHTTGKNIVLINDDVFLTANAVAAMKALMKPGVGMACGILRYPDGTIYHAGKRRMIGQRGFGHIDHRQRDCTTKEASEMENLNGAAIMTDRIAHFQSGAYDEEFYLYSEDDAISLQMRRAGYKLMFAPFESGEHLEHQSTKKTGNIMAIVSAANAVFHRKWGQYYDHNLTKPGFGTFDY